MVTEMVKLTERTDKWVLESKIQERLNKEHKWTYEKIAERIYKSLESLGF